MPSVSKAQQRFMGLVHAYKKGEVPASQVSQAVKDAAKSMKKKSTKKMASTKHDNLPNKVRSENMNEDGHTDVASAERKLKLIMKDAMDTLNALRNLSNEDSLPSWWTDKITLAKDYVGKSRDYIMNPAESVNEKTVSIGGEDLMKYLMKRFKMSKRQAIASMKKHKMDMSFLKKESVNEKVIKVSKKDDIPGNPMKMKGEEKIKKLTYSGSVGMDKPGSYEIKGNKLNVNNIRPRDKGFFVRHFTMGTGFRKANLYYDGVHWQGGKKF